MEAKIVWLESQIHELRGVLTDLHYSTWQCNGCSAVFHESNKPTGWCCKRHEDEDVVVYCDDCIDDGLCECTPPPSDDEQNEGSIPDNALKAL